MRVIGIVYEHDATVCLMEDGRITFCQSEERFDRVKQSFGFPFRTLEHVYAHVAPRDSIDLAVIYETALPHEGAVLREECEPSGEWSPASGRSAMRTMKDLALTTAWGSRLSEWRIRRRQNDPSARRRAHAFFARLLGLPAGKVVFMDHHLAHAWSVVPSVLPWGRALVFTLDGGGDGLCATVSLVEEGRLTRLSACAERHSLGYFYADTATVLGMNGSEDEFKVMALAGYASREEVEPLLAKLRGLLSIDAKGEWNSVPTAGARFGALAEACRFARFDVTAGAVQSLTEELISRWVAHWVAKTGCGDIAVAGGVFMNVKASQKVAQLPDVSRLFVMPSAGDESCAIGAAAWGTRQLDASAPLEPLGDLYLGVEYGEREVAEAIAASGATSRYEISRPADINREVARLLADNRIVARCAGRMEFGARALGNRSILAHPGHLENVRRINDAIKERDFWLPFAPAILEEEMARYVAGYEKAFAPYMCIAFDSTEVARGDLQAAMHAGDLTLRPQAIRREWNRDFHEIVSAFRELTGTGAVLNTSFNLHGEPIVCSPADAIRTTDLSAIEHLMLGGHLLSKRREGAAR